MASALTSPSLHRRGRASEREGSQSRSEERAGRGGGWARTRRPPAAQSPATPGSRGVRKSASLVPLRGEGPVPGASAWPGPRPPGPPAPAPRAVHTGRGSFPSFPRRCLLLLEALGFRPQVWKRGDGSALPPQTLGRQETGTPPGPPSGPGGAPDPRPLLAASQSAPDQGPSSPALSSAPPSAKGRDADTKAPRAAPGPCWLRSGAP